MCSICSEVGVRRSLFSSKLKTRQPPREAAAKAFSGTRSCRISPAIRLRFDSAASPKPTVRSFCNWRAARSSRNRPTKSRGCLRTNGRLALAARAPVVLVANVAMAFPRPPVLAGWPSRGRAARWLLTRPEWSRSNQWLISIQQPRGASKRPSPTMPKSARIIGLP